ncbi:MAG: hypothetical protein INR71_01695, partial [Terriglobus roseus]|nr:hypothetical protein [Terriglobus roseus]
MNEQWGLPQNGNALYPPQAGGANGMLDANMFNPAALDLNQFQNGQMRNPSPAFTNPQYNVNPVVPSKRPRPSDDGIQASPRQPAAHNPNLSRSQTPHQPGAFPGFPGAQQQHPPNPYQHLQQTGSGNATPSPVLQDTQFRPPSTAQRMNASPSPFPGAQPGMGMSPPPDMNGNRVNTPQTPAFNMNGMQMPPSSMPQAFNQNFGGASGMTPNHMQGAGMPQQVHLSQNLAQRQAEAQRLYQMRLQAHQQQNSAQRNAMAADQQNRGMMGGNMAAAQAMQGQNSNMNTPTRNPGAMPNAQQAAAGFMKTLSVYMQQVQKPFDPNPTVCGRPVSLYLLYMHVMRSKGSQVVNSKNQWPAIAQTLGFQPAQIIPQAAMELKAAYEKNLAPYESAFWRSRQNPTQMNQQMQPSQHSMGQQMSPTRGPAPSGNSSLDISQQTLQQQYFQQMSKQAQTPQQVNQMTPVQSNASLPATNGWSTPQSDGAGPQRQGSMGAPNKVPKPEPSPAVQQPAMSVPSPATTVAEPQGQGQGQAAEQARPYKDIKPPQDDSDNYIPKVYHLTDHYGGWAVKSIND